MIEDESKQRAPHIERVPYRRIPVGAAYFIVGVGAGGRKEIPSLRDIFFPLLPSYLHLLLLSTTSEIILFEGTLAFIGYGTRGASIQRYQTHMTGKETTFSTGLHGARLSTVVHCYRCMKWHKWNEK
jgi:hypothetical protein